MALPKFYKVCQDQQGNIVPQVLGSVFNHGTAVLASLYQDDAGTIPLANPMTSDAQYGSFKFYVNPGHYDLSFTKPGYTFEPINDMQVPQDVLTLGTMATQNADAVAITGGTISLPAVGLGTPANPTYPLLVATGLQSWLNGPLGLGDAPNPSYILNAVGNTRVAGNGEVTGRETCAQLGVNGAPDGNVRAQITYNKATDFGLKLRQTGTDTGGITLLFSNVSDTAVGSITTTASATAFNTSSDVRLKHSIAPLTGSLAVLAALNPISHRWNADDSYAENFLAHELQRVLAYAVTGEPDAVNEDGSIRPQQVDASKIIPRLVGAVQELLAQVETLTARVATLEDALA